MASVLTPYSTGQAVDLSRTLWRKQVLKHGTIDYKGRKIVFDKKMTSDLAAAFRAGAYDQVPFLLADPDNRHHSDPEKYRGEVKAMIPTDDGLDILLEVSERGADLLRDNPRLGVSARIVEDLTQADGRSYPRAVEHVLGTLNPVVTGMRPWEQIELSAPAGPVLDLTTSIYQREAAMPDTLTAEELAALRALLAKQTPEPPPAPVGVIPPPTAAGPEELSDEQIEQIVAGLLADTGTASTAPPAAAVPVPAAAGAELSAEVKAALDLAQANENQRAAQLQALQAQVDSERFTREAAEYRAAGVPPKLVELAQPLLQGSKHVIDLSNGGKVDAGAIVRAILDECKGTIDLAAERGALFPGVNTPPDEATAAKDLVAEFQRQYGMRRSAK